MNFLALFVIIIAAFGVSARVESATRDQNPSAKGAQMPSQIMNNSPGGIQAGGSVNIYGPRPLVLTEEQKALVTKSVQPFAKDFADRKVDISIHNANSEIMSFGDALASAFTQAGYGTNAGAVTFVGAALDRGVTIRFGSNKEGLAVAVRDALLQGGAVQQVAKAQGINADDFLIIVAP